MGHTHVLTGLGAWLAVGPVALAAVEGTVSLVGPDLPPATGTGMVLATLVCGGAAMLPDIDHPDAVIARTYGPLWSPVAHFVNWAAGGHRKATHSLGFAALAGLLTASALWSSVAVAVVVGALIGLAVAAGVFAPLGINRGMALPVTALAALGVWGSSRGGTGSFLWLPVAVTVGSLVHLAGDFVTPGGVPWLWPSRRRYAFALMETDGVAERGPVTVVLSLAVLALIGWRVGLYEALLYHARAT